MDLGEKLFEFTTKNAKGWIFLKLVLTAVPPAILGYATLRLSPDPEKVLPLQPALQMLLLDHPFVTTFILLLPLLATSGFSIVDHIISKNKEGWELSHLLSVSIVEALDDVVGTKLRRFNKYAKDVLSNKGKSTYCKSFDTITQPQDQISAIVHEVYHVLEMITRDSSLQLILVKMKNDLPYEWADTAPHHLQPSQRLLGENGRKTLFHDTAHQRKELYISDIEEHVKAKRKKPLFCYSDNPDADKGSIICYPVTYQVTDEVIYVISIKSDIPKAINEKFTKRFKPLINAFCTRLRLEYNLAYIKEASQPCQQTIVC